MPKLFTIESTETNGSISIDVSCPTRNHRAIGEIKGRERSLGHIVFMRARPRSCDRSSTGPICSRVISSVHSSARVYLARRARVLPTRSWRVRDTCTEVTARFAERSQFRGIERDRVLIDRIVTRSGSTRGLSASNAIHYHRYFIAIAACAHPRTFSSPPP